METEIIIIYVLCAEYLQAIGHHEDPQVKMSDAEVMTTALVAITRVVGGRPGVVDHPGLELGLGLVPGGPIYWQSLFKRLSLEQST